MRSLKKGYYVTNKALLDAEEKNVYPRRAHVSGYLESALIRVHDGKKDVQLNILSDMEAYPIGSFVVTKKRGNIIHLHGRKKKKKGK